MTLVDRRQMNRKDVNMCKRIRISVGATLLLSLTSGGSVLGDSTTITYTGEAGGICETSEDQTIDVGAMEEGIPFVTSIRLTCNTRFEFDRSFSPIYQALVHSDFNEGNFVLPSGHRLTAPYSLLVTPTPGATTPPFDGDISVTIEFIPRDEPLLAGDYSGSITFTVNPQE